MNQKYTLAGSLYPINAFSRTRLYPIGPFISRRLQALSAHFAVAIFDYTYTIHLKFINDTAGVMH